MRKVPSKYIVRQDKFVWRSLKKVIIPALVFAVALTIYEYKIGGDMFDYHSLKLYGVCIAAIFVFLYEILEIVLIPHKDKIEIMVDEDGLYLDTTDIEKPKPKMLSWEDIEDIQIEKFWKDIIYISLISGKTLRFNYALTGLNLCKFKETVRYFSGRNDFMKKNYISLWLRN